jgi:hypothetical protein
MAAHVRIAGTLRVAASPADAFRFFTPEGERLWVPGWDPEYLHPADGALVDGLTFRTNHGGELTIWLVTGVTRPGGTPSRRSGRPGGAIDYVRVTPESRIGTVKVRLTPDGPGLPERRYAVPPGGVATEVTVEYCLTSLSASGDQKLAAFAAEFQDLVASWERSIEDVIISSKFKV